jgi:hypothetical protein
VAQLDIGKTAFSGFGVIGRHPVAPIVWGLVALVLSLLPMLLILPAMLEFFAMAMKGVKSGAEPDMSEMMRLQTQMNIVSPLSWILGLFSYGLTTGALFRAMLKPAEKSWFFMRVGMAEVMLVVVTIVYVILFVVACLILGLIVALAAWGANMASDGAGLWVAILLGMVAGVVAIWGALRFSLAFAMSWERKAFLLFESWNLTKGNAFSLFLMALVNFIVCLVIILFVTGLLFGVGIFAVLGGGGFEALNSNDPEAFFTPERLMSMIPVAIVLITLWGIVQSYIQVLTTAPWAEAYRELVPTGEEVF